MLMLQLGAWSLFTSAPHDGLQHMCARLEINPIGLELPILNQTAMRSS